MKFITSFYCTKSCGAKAQQTPSPCCVCSFSDLTKNVIRSSHGHSAPSLKISCKSVQPFSRNLANKDTKKRRNRSKTIPRPPIYQGRGKNKIHWRFLNIPSQCCLYHNEPYLQCSKHSSLASKQALSWLHHSLCTVFRLPPPLDVSVLCSFDKNLSNLDLFIMCHATWTLSEVFQVHGP